MLRFDVSMIRLPNGAFCLFGSLFNLTTRHCKRVVPRSRDSPNKKRNYRTRRAWSNPDATVSGEMHYELISHRRSALRIGRG